TTLVVGDDMRIEFSRAVIATGSSPAIPAALRPAGDRLIVNDDVFAWAELPRSLAIFGPGVIGLELGQALHRLGVEVLMFGRSGRVGPFTDPAIRMYATQAFRQELALDPAAEVNAIERVDDRVLIRYRGSDAMARTATVDFVIA